MIRIVGTESVLLLELFSVDVVYAGTLGAAGPPPSGVISQPHIILAAYLLPQFAPLNTVACIFYPSETALFTFQYFFQIPFSVHA